VEAGKGQLHLGLHSRDLRDLETGRLVHDGSEQRRLANARLAPYDQDRAAAVARVIQEFFERLTLSEPVA
jgi:hypothetical protein